jgi:nucleotide-binding universal stress UspA family protein
VDMAGTVVCGIDASAESLRAAQVAGRLARALGARPVLVHAIEERPSFVCADRRERAGERSLEEAQALLGETRLDGFAEVERRIARAEPADALASVALEMHAKLVAVGSRGRGPLRAALLGSTSRAAIRRCSCPVLVLPRGVVAPAFGRRSVICGIDSSRESEHAASVAGIVADRLELELVLVHVQIPRSPVALRSRGVHPPPDHAEQLELRRQAAARLVGRVKEAASLSRATRERTERGGVTDRLDQAAAEEDAELIVVAARGLGALGAIMLGSVSSKLAATASRPVLVVKRDTAAKFV